MVAVAGCLPSCGEREDVYFYSVASGFRESRSCMTGHDVDGFSEGIDDILFYPFDACANDTSAIGTLIFFIGCMLGILEERLEC